MNTSKEVNNIFSALVKMRPEIVTVAKTKAVKTPRYTYHYAPLDTIIELLMNICPKYGLGFIQTIGGGFNDIRTLTTRIIHESGEWIEDTFILPEPEGGNENQELGMSITYFRRYALASAFGIACDDDQDGAVDVIERKQAARGRLSGPGEEKQDLSTLLWSTGDGASDAQIRALVRSCERMSEKTISWINDKISHMSTTEALVFVSETVNKINSKKEEA